MPAASRKESVFVLICGCTCRPKPLTNIVSFTFPASLWIWPRGRGGGHRQAGARGAAFRAFLPPDSSWYHGCEPEMSKNSS